MGGTPVVVPKEMVNDDVYVVATVLARPGTAVERGQALAELETSKASFVLESPSAGYFATTHTAGDTVAVGGVFGTITPEPVAAGQAESEGGQGPDPRFSKAAWALFAESGLSLDRFADMPLVGRAEVEAALAATVPLPRPDELTAAERERAIVLVGGGGHARECLDIVELTDAYRVFGFIDTRSSPGALIEGYPVLGGNEALPRLLAAGLRNLVLAYGFAGNQAARGDHFRALCAAGHDFPPLPHPKAAVNRTAVLGPGAQVMGCALVGSRAVVGAAGIVNSGAVVSHDCELADNVHIAPGAVLAGGVRVGADAVVGMGATVYRRVHIGRGALIHNGAAVFADVPEGMEVRGEWRGK